MPTTIAERAAMFQRRYAKVLRELRKHDDGKGGNKLRDQIEQEQPGLMLAVHQAALTAWMVTHRQGANHG